MSIEIKKRIKVNVNVNLSLLLHKLSGLNYNLISPNTHHYPGLVYHRGVFYTTRKVQSNLYYEFSIHLVHKLCAGAAPHHATCRYWEKRHVVWGPLGVDVVGKKSIKKQQITCSCQMSPRYRVTTRATGNTIIRRHSKSIPPLVWGSQEADLIRKS